MDREDWDRIIRASQSRSKGLRGPGQEWSPLVWAVLELDAEGFDKLLQGNKRLGEVLRAVESDPSHFADFVAALGDDLVELLPGIRQSLEGEADREASAELAPLLTSDTGKLDPTLTTILGAAAVVLIVYTHPQLLLLGLAKELLSTAETTLGTINELANWFPDVAGGAILLNAAAALKTFRKDRSIAETLRLVSCVVS